MNDLLTFAIEAHGGLERWDKVNAVQAAASLTGAIWQVKGRPNVLKDVVITSRTKQERVDTRWFGVLSPACGRRHDETSVVANP